MTWVEKMDVLPPIACRILALAKDRRTLATNAELSKRTGWSLHKLRTVYNSNTWAHVPCGDADAFMKACGVTPENRRRKGWLVRLAIRRGGLHTMRHLRMSQFYQAEHILAQVRKLYGIDA